MIFVIILRYMIFVNVNKLKVLVFKNIVYFIINFRIKDYGFKINVS